MQLPEITQVTKISSQPGDVFVISSPDRLSIKGHAAIQAQWQDILPGTRLIILDGGIKLEAILQPGMVKPDHIMEQGAT